MLHMGGGGHTGLRHMGSNGIAVGQGEGGMATVQQQPLLLRVPMVPAAATQSGGRVCMQGGRDDARNPLTGVPMVIPQARGSCTVRW